MKQQPAFTLVELMITMAIIAILATAGILAYTDYTKKWRDTARAQIAQNLNSSVMAYAASNGGNPPAGPDEFSAFLASAGETFGGGGVSGSTLVVDPVWGKEVCLDALWEATEPCRFDYTAYEDGTYAISYGVEHTSSTEENFYATTWSVLADDDTNGTKIKTKYGVYTGSAPYIGSTPTKSNPVSENWAPIAGVDVSYAPVGATETIAMADVFFKRKRIDAPTNPLVVLKANEERCENSSECQGGLCGPYGDTECSIPDGGMPECYTTHICITKPENYCDNTADCATGYYCPNSLILTIPSTCTPKGSTGSSCSEGAQCMSEICTRVSFFSGQCE